MSAGGNDDAKVLEASQDSMDLHPTLEQPVRDRPAVGSTDVYDFSVDAPMVSWSGAAPRGDRDSEGATNTWPGEFAPPDPASMLLPSAAPELDFGRYVLEKEIGRGGMGVVYRARQKDLDRHVAIKMILASHLASPEQVERFYAEARAAARVQHPNIVVIHEVGQIHGQHYFAMEYVSGPSLMRLLRDGPPGPDLAARIVLAVARAVQHLHAQGIIHRDLKPSNILLDEAGQPYVTDFGLAKMLASDSSSTKTGAIVGTPSYMSPEQAAGRKGVGPRSDVYSLGAILYELLTGRPPFGGDNPMETLVHVLEGEPPRPCDIYPGIPSALQAICLKCLEKDPANRYRTAAALADDLGRYLQGEPIEARKEGPWLRLRRWARREPALATRLGTMAACGIIMQANHWLVDAPGEEPPRRPIAIVLVWGLASMAFQAMVRRGLRADALRFAWAWADVMLFTFLILVNDVLQTSLVAGYFLVVAASGLWFRERLVWFATFMSVSAYGALVVIKNMHAQLDPDAPSYAYRHFIFALALAVSGLIISYQVKRTRSLSHYYEHRPPA